MGHITVTMKIHRPGAGKRAVLDKALKSYQDAFFWLTTRASQCIESFHADSDKGNRYRSARYLRNWVDKDMSRELNQFGVEPFKDALKNDFAAYMASYLAKRELQPDTRFVPIRSRSLSFCRCDTKRDWCLVYHPLKDRFYAKMYLTNRDGSIRNPHVGEMGHLIHLHRDRTPLQDNAKMIRYLLLPLQFGKRQEALLKEAIAHPERVRSAKLRACNGEWYLVASIETEVVPPQQTVAWIGFSRAMESALSWTVSDADGHILSSGAEPVPQQARRQDGTWTLNALHGLTNRMTALAVEHKAQAVVAPLVHKGDHLHWVEADGTLSGPQIDGRIWNRLLSLIPYKLEREGLPAPVIVSPNNMFRCCPRCGTTTRKNRMGRTRFLCIQCGHVQSLDEVGSANLSRRLHQYASGPVPIRVEKTASGVRFVQPLIHLDLTLPSSPSQGELSVMQSLNEVLTDMVTAHAKREVSGHASQAEGCPKNARILQKLANYNHPIQGVTLVERSLSST